MSIARLMIRAGLGFAIMMLLWWLLLRRKRADWFGSHLRILPISRLRNLLMARFLRMASVGFMVDVILGGSMSRPLVLLFASLFGLCGPAILLLRQRPPFQRLLFVMPIVFIIYGFAIIHRTGVDLPSPSAAAAYRFDAFCIFVTLVASAFVTTQHINTEGARQLRAETELEAARAVQQVLIPDEIPSLPAFKIESVYQPAGQVGGDFFQILPTAQGGALIVIGDVSGKGMPAAMTVSLLVGTFRTLAHYTSNPGEILAAMNRRMLARSKDGFTTCLVLRADPDGALTVANAGHLPPYCNHEELAVDGGLPLGIRAESTYEEARLELRPGVQITLLTDGVVEARSKTGELFGFARAQNLSSRSAEQIAETACAFGQEDDITVVTLAFAGGTPVATESGEFRPTHSSSFG
ncbi:MAG TPA: PP2C family protein-serine/threonine phosphatase [Terracidiphilus sp.]|nr:PP2C family protein-serine/threonine phosphatase [Terracidiphilus sp.]